MIQTTLNISGMMCSMCEAHINDAVRAAFPVRKVTSSQSKGETVILSDAPLDMEKLKYVSSGGLRAFKHAYLELRKKGGTLQAKNVNKMVMEVFEVTGFTRLIEII